MQNIALNLEYTKPEATTPQWKAVLLGEVFAFTKKPRDLHFSNYQYIPFVPMEYIPNGSALFDQFELRARTDISSGTYFEPGDILLAKITPSFENGKQGIIEDLPIPFGIATTEVIPIKEIKGVSNKYYLFFYLLKHDIRSLLTSKMEGSTGRQRLSVTTLTNLEIYLPPLPEQRTIAHILQIVQQAIQTRRKELELERECRAALMQRLFMHGTRNEPTKQSEIGKIPESWNVVRLGKKCIVQYGLGQPPQWDDNGIPMVRATDINNGRIIKETVRRINIETISKKRTHFLKKGDIIVVRSGAYAGDVAIYNSEWDIAIAGYDLIISPLDEAINSFFLTSYLLSETNQQYFRSQRDRSAQPHINSDQLKNTLIPLPSKKEEQTEIAQALQICNTKIAALEKEITLHEELFRALLDQLMTGRISTLPLIAQLEKGTLTHGQRTPDSTGTTH